MANINQKAQKITISVNTFIRRGFSYIFSVVYYCPLNAPTRARSPINVLYKLLFVADSR